MTVENQLPIATSTNQWDVIFGGASAHLVLDDPVGSPDDDLTYVENTDGTNANVDLTHTDFALSGATSINNVCQTFRCKETGDGNGQCRHLIYVNGTRYNGTIQSPGASYVTYNNFWTANPATTSAWTIAEANGSDATNPYDSKMGARALTGAGEAIRMTQLFACCDFESGTAHEKALADSISMSDANSNLTGKALSDSVTMSEQFSSVSAYIRALNDTMNLSDANVKGISVNKEDSITLTDVFSKSLIYLRSLSDSITLSDTIAKSIEIPRSDTMGLSDLRVSGVGLARSDSIILTDNHVSIIITLILNLSDSISMSDSHTKGIETSKADTINLTDDFSRVISYLRSLSDSITLSDLKSMGIGLDLDDSIALSDAISKQVELSKADAVSLSDQVAKQFELSKADTTALTDFFSHDGAGVVLLFAIEQLGLKSMRGLF